MTPPLLHISLIPGGLATVWPRIYDAVEQLSQIPGEDWLPEHVFQEIIAGGTHLFTTSDFRAFLVTQILPTPYSRTLHVWLASNDWGGNRKDFFEQLKSIAAENDCNRITWRSDRTGWERALPGVRTTTEFSYDMAGD